ncbi:MAG: hypothetical protein HC933_18795 [Pleurocapsa sp. SU_196_0]|nr:hypothetical protein [Pleurocapsa sp. SU_196_0]
MGQVHLENPGFSLEYPNGWGYFEQISGVRFEARRGDSTVAAFDISVFPAQSLEAWVKSRKSSETLPDGSSRVEKVRNARVAGLPSQQIVLFAFDRYVLEEAVVVGQHLYVLSFDEDNPNDPQFKTHAAMYARMRSSLRFR